MRDRLFDFLRPSPSLSTVSSVHCTRWLGRPVPLTLTVPWIDGAGSGAEEDEEASGCVGSFVTVRVREPWLAGIVFDVLDPCMACLSEYARMQEVQEEEPSFSSPDSTRHSDKAHCGRLAKATQIARTKGEALCQNPSRTEAGRTVSVDVNNSLVSGRDSGAKT